MGRGKKKKATPEQIRKRNQWNKERKARHKLKTWFKENDFLILLTYKREDRPTNMKMAKWHFSEKPYGVCETNMQKEGMNLGGCVT